MPARRQRIATGFHRNTLTNREGGIDPAQFRDEQVIDRTNTVGITWLGLTVGCAQCHNHKYDPITQKEYYQLFAFFNTAEELNIEAPMPGELGPYLAAKGEYERKRQELLEEYKVPELQAEWEEKMRDVEVHQGKLRGVGLPVPGLPHPAGQRDQDPASRAGAADEAAGRTRSPITSSRTTARWRARSSTSRSSSRS